MNNCPACLNNPAIVHPRMGLLPCAGCTKRQNALPRPHIDVEIIPEYIKEERTERADSIEQPHVAGDLNKRYVDLWGEQAARDRGFSEKEIKNAKYVYDKLRTKTRATKYYNDST